MRIDTSCDVAKLAEMLAQRRVLEPERGFNPFTRSSLSPKTKAENRNKARHRMPGPYRRLCGAAEAANKTSTDIQRRLDRCRDTGDKPCEHSGTARAEAS